jgi:hypothetical protein
MEAQPSSLRVRLWQVQTLCVKRERPWGREIGRGPCPLVLKTCKSVTFKSGTAGIHMGMGHRETGFPGENAKFCTVGHSRALDETSTLSNLRF